MVIAPNRAGVAVQAENAAPRLSLTERPKRLFGLKIFFAVSLIGFSAISLPSKGSAEPILTSDNLLQALNQDRVQYGLKPLVENPELQRAAVAKARDILNNNYFAHVSPTGVQPWDFIKAAGFAYSFAGENLALNYTNPTELEHDFLQSPAHRENLLSPLFTEIGIAVVPGITRGQPAVITVQMFGTPAPTSVAQTTANSELARTP